MIKFYDQETLTCNSGLAMERITLWAINLCPWQQRITSQDASDVIKRKVPFLITSCILNCNKSNWPLVENKNKTNAAFINRDKWEIARGTLRDLSKIYTWMGWQYHCNYLSIMEHIKISVEHAGIPSIYATPISRSASTERSCESADFNRNLFRSNKVHRINHSIAKRLKVRFISYGNEISI